MGALAGLVVALVAVVLAHVTGNAVWEGTDVAEARLRAAVPVTQVIYIEPDLFRED